MKNQKWLFGKVDTICFFIAGGIGAVGLFFAAGHDLRLAQMLYHPQSIWAIFMEAFGWWMLFMPVVLLFLTKATYEKQKGLWQWVLWLMLASFTQMGLFVGSAYYLKQRGIIQGITDVFAWLWFVPVIALFCFLSYKVLHLQASALHRSQFLFRFGTVYMVCNLLLVNVLKLIWQRPRFDEMLAEDRISDFMAWYQPLGPGGSSFPSGHTASACGILVLLIMCDLFPAWKRRKIVVIIFCWAYIVLMALSRMVMGRHFLSDTIAAMVVMAVLFMLMHQSGYYQRKLLQLPAAE